MKKFFFLLSLFALLCATVPGTSFAEVATRTNQVWYRIHFGLGVGKAAVSPQMVHQFVDTEVASRFTMGFNMEPRALGQWTSDKGLIRENNFIINIFVDNTEESAAKIAEVGEEYIRRFGKSKASVFVVKINVNDTMHFFN